MTTSQRLPFVLAVLALGQLGLTSVVLAQPDPPTGPPREDVPEPPAAASPEEVDPTETENDAAPAPISPTDEQPDDESQEEAGADEPQEPAAAPHDAAPTATSESAAPPAAAVPVASNESVEATPLVDTANGSTALADQARGWDEEPGVEDEDVALALPRAVLFVPKLVLEVVFLPIKAVFVLVDDANLVAHAEDIIYFDDTHDVGWHPSLDMVTHFGTTVGAKLFHKSLFGHRERAEVEPKYGGRYTQSYELLFDADRLGGSRLWLETRGRFESAKGELFAGIGAADSLGMGPNLDPRAGSTRTYFATDRVLGLLRMGHTAGEPGRYVQTGGTVIFNERDFARNRTGQAETEDVYDTALLPGFDDGVTTIELQANVVMDYRATQGLDSRGGYLEMFGGHVTGSPADYWHYGAEVSYTLNLYRRTRLLTARTAIEAVEGDDSEIPFSDLARLGGTDRLRGYTEDQFRDRRAALASLEYHYPIHKNVLGELFVDAGFVAQRFEDLYDIRDWKVGYGGGLILGSDDSVTLVFELAVGDGLHLMLSTDLARAFDERSAQL